MLLRRDWGDKKPNAGKLPGEWECVLYCHWPCKRDNQSGGNDQPIIAAHVLVPKAKTCGWCLNELA